MILTLTTRRKLFMLMLLDEVVFMQLFIGVIIGYVISFLVLKRSINKAGYGELKMCRETCPYYRTAVNNAVKNEVTDDEQ